MTTTNTLSSSRSTCLNRINVLLPFCRESKLQQPSSGKYPICRTHCSTAMEMNISVFPGSPPTVLTWCLGDCLAVACAGINRDVNLDWILLYSLESSSNALNLQPFAGIQIVLHPSHQHVPVGQWTCLACCKSKPEISFIIVVFAFWRLSISFIPPSSHISVSMAQSPFMTVNFERNLFH